MSADHPPERTGQVEISGAPIAPYEPTYLLDAVENPLGRPPGPSLSSRWIADPMGGRRRVWFVEPAQVPEWPFAAGWPISPPVAAALLRSP